MSAEEFYHADVAGQQQDAWEWAQSDDDAENLGQLPTVKPVAEASLLQRQPFTHGCAPSCLHARCSRSFGW